MNPHSRCSIIVPVYRNAASLAALTEELQTLGTKLPCPLEVVFVDDGSPDNSTQILKKLFASKQFNFEAKLIRLSRNFGSFNAIRAGLDNAGGQYLAVMAADLQDPPEAILSFLEKLLQGECDVVLGTRQNRRNDPWLTRATSHLFWGCYRRLVQKEMPSGGFDLFACTAQARDVLSNLRESRSSLVGMVLWAGFRRAAVPYERRLRTHGKSAWSFTRRVRYVFDSAFSFSNLPITCLLVGGAVGITLSIMYLVLVMVLTLCGRITQPGFPTLAGLITVFGGANLFALGILGEYAWRAYENTKGRPNFVVMSREALGNDFGASAGHGKVEDPP
jgi:glycosyltransferase involved in cell wall biosynthesis